MENLSQVITTLYILLVTIFIFMTYWYFMSTNIERVDIVDIAWGLAFIVTTVVSLIFNKNYFVENLVLQLLVLLWGLRLAIYIYIRNKDKKQDKRYQKLLKKWKNKKSRIYLNVFMLQGFLALLISSNVWLFHILDVNKVRAWNWIGILVWIIGFYFEAVGDWQLLQSKKNSKNKDKIMKEGLWKYSRHPNYFGEVTMWWGIFIYVLGSVPLWLAIISPATISYLIFGVSGIPMAEKFYKNNAEFKKYAKKTSKFFPLPPKRKT